MKAIDDASTRLTNVEILDETLQGTSAAEVARRYGIDSRVLRRWKQELAGVTAPTFVTVEVADAEALS